MLCVNRPYEVQRETGDKDVNNPGSSEKKQETNFKTNSWPLYLDVPEDDR